MHLGLKPNKIEICEYDVSRIETLNKEKEGLAYFLRNIKCHVIGLNESSTKYTISEPVIDIGISLYDKNDILAAKDILSSHGYQVIKSASNYEKIVLHYVENGLVLFRIYIFDINSNVSREFELFKRYLKSNGNIEDFNNFMKSNYQKHGNNPDLFRQYRIQYIHHVIHNK